MNDIEKMVLTVPELAQALCISKNTAYSIIHIPGFPKLYVGKKILIPKKALEDYINKK